MTSHPRPNRRAFLNTAAAVGCAAAVPLTHATPAQAVKAPLPKRPIGVSTYSFWGFERKELQSIEKCIDLAAEMGFDGVEILQVQMTDTSNAALQSLKRQAFSRGLDLMGFSTHQGFLTPDREKWQASFDHTVKCMEQAYALGIPTMRVNTGRWGTAKDFDELMANRGIEPRLEGYTDEDGFKWVIEAFEKLTPTAEKLGVVLGLENHWGLGLTAAGVRRVVDAIASPWLQVTLDTGNFLEEPYPQLEALAANTVLVQAKTYQGGGRWYTLDLDYPRIAKILDAANFRGYISLEFEGKADPLIAIPESLEMLRKTLGRRTPA
jgi:sugar phosphate isomerase/epimerase